MGIGFYPPWADAVYPDSVRPKGCCQRMGEGHDAALGSRIGLSVRLGHKGAWKQY